MMRRGWVLAVCLVLAGVPLAGQQLQSVAERLLPKLEAAHETVAVVDFTDLRGNPTELGRFLAEDLSVTIASEAKGFTVIDRTHLKAILQENKLSATGMIDPQTARQLGKLAGVQVLITGTLTPLGDSVHLSVKALDAETAAMLAATSTEVPRTKAIDELLTRGLGGPQPNGPSGPSDSPGVGPSIQQASAGGVTIQVQRCDSSGLCRFVATAARDLLFSVNLITGWDDSGNEYRCDSAGIGNQESSAQLIAGVRTPVTCALEAPRGSGFVGSLSGRGRGRRALPTSLPLRVFPALQAPEARRSASLPLRVFSALQVDYRVDYVRYSVRFRNIRTQ